MVHETDLDETTANAGTLALILLSFFSRSERDKIWKRGRKTSHQRNKLKLCQDFQRKIYL